MSVHVTYTYVTSRGTVGHGDIYLPHVTDSSDTGRTLVAALAERAWLEVLQRGDLTAYVHTCGQLEWFPHPPAAGGCDACESGSPDPADWRMVYTDDPTRGGATVDGGGAT